MRRRRELEGGTAAVGVTKGSPFPSATIPGVGVDGVTLASAAPFIPTMRSTTAYRRKIRTTVGADADNR